MVIAEFHEWLLAQRIESYVIVVKDTPLEKYFRSRGHKDSVVTVSRGDNLTMYKARKAFDSPKTAFLFHRQQGLKAMRFRKFSGKISMLSHTFYGVKKRDFWHRLIFNKVNSWIVLTERQKKNLIETTGVDQRRVKVIPNGVNLKLFIPAFRPAPNKHDEIQVGVIARLDPKKGQDIAIRALAKLRNEIKLNIVLNLYGESTPNEPSILPQLKSLACKLGVESYVKFHGFLEIVSQCIQKLDVVWLPSHHETFGRCVIESMAVGVPVIASNSGGVPDIINHQQNGILFQTKNYEDLVSKTMLLIEDPDLFAKIQINGRKDVEKNYDQEAIWRGLLEVISPNNTKSDDLSLFKHPAF
jgi:glycosyltransferase involved in cell wall biosynthesis